MLVVADSSPLNVLIRIRSIEVLGHLFTEVLVPEQVLHELTDARTPAEVREFMASPPGWMRVRAPASAGLIPPLGPGESAAINLAIEERASAILIDERDGRRAAAARHLRVIGTVGVLEEAARRGLLVLAEVYERLRASDFRVDPRLIQDSLERDARRRAGGAS